MSIGILTASTVFANSVTIAIGNGNIGNLAPVSVLIIGVVTVGLIVWVVLRFSTKFNAFDKTPAMESEKPIYFTICQCI